jgi:hypothetical protein
MVAGQAIPENSEKCGGDGNSGEAGEIRKITATNENGKIL